MALKAEALKQLHKRREAVHAGGGTGRLEERRAKGLLSARERLAALFEDGTFQESGMHVQHRAQAFDLAGKNFLEAEIVRDAGER